MRRWYAVAAAVVTGWGTIPLLLRSVDLPAAATAFARVAIAALVLGVAVVVERGRGPARPVLFSRLPVRTALTAAMLGVHWLALFAAYRRAPVGTVILIVYLAPVGVAALAPAVLGERLARSTVAALALAIAGFVLLAAPSVRKVGWVGLAMAVFTMVTFVALILLSKPLAEIYGGLRLAFMEMAGAAIVLLPVAATTSWGRPRSAWSLLVVLAVVHTAFGIALYLSALERLPATHIGIMGYLEPAAVIGFAWAFLSEAPAATSIMGGVLVVAAGVLVVAIPAADPPLRTREETARAGR